MGLVSASTVFIAQAADKASRTAAAALNTLTKPKASITIESTGTTLYVMFNPSDYTEKIKVHLNDGHSSGYDDFITKADVTGQTFSQKSALTERANKLFSKLGIDEVAPSVKPYFRCTTKESFDVKLFYDTYEAGTSVTDETDAIKALTMPTEAGTVGKHPPICTFKWKSFSYRGIVTKFEQKFTMFLFDGTPVRAELDLTFSPVYDASEIKDFLGREACRKLWTVTSKDRLDLIANEVYKDPAQWIVIATANDIPDPLNFPSKEHLGMELVLPDLT